MKAINFFLFVLLSTFYSFTFAQVIPIPGAHAHNDYNHDHPLVDALTNGFTSIEVDVLLIEGEIYVGHDMPQSANELPTITELYLIPLDSIIRENGGFIYPGYTQTCYLMIDIKTDAEATYHLLKEQLLPFKSWIRRRGANDGAITIILSGNRPIQTVMNDPDNLLSLDGRPEDLGQGFDAEVMPVVSQNYNLYSRWQGSGDMPGPDQKKIRELVENTHLEGKMLRLWAHPETPDTWRVLLSLGVDFINVDNLEEFRDFFLNR